MSVWDRTKKIALWIVSNGLWCLLGVLGAIYGVGWAWGVFTIMTFLANVLMVFIILGIIASHATNKPIKADFNPTFPVWVELIIDSAMTLIVVSFGHWFVGFWIFTQTIGSYYIRKEFQAKPDPNINTPA